MSLKRTFFKSKMFTSAKDVSSNKVLILAKQNKILNFWVRRVKYVAKWPVDLDNVVVTFCGFSYVVSSKGSEDNRNYSVELVWNETVAKKRVKEQDSATDFVATLSYGQMITFEWTKQAKTKLHYFFDSQVQRFVADLWLNGFLESENQGLIQKLSTTYYVGKHATGGAEFTKYENKKLAESAYLRISLNYAKVMVGENKILQHHGDALVWWKSCVGAVLISVVDETYAEQGNLYSLFNTLNFGSLLPQQK
ncbi:hypothetical protein RFI_18438 [Reticulomyxa filosa]|uniref:Uncharacterized protein n=1 Tax=Reticulomyxa filosa TaxID=46433 RepID=X6MXQ2_RETFI|nr:hypothetical protein RFI_18438 [Reticulomyxa filosa]|eukprot:ETO18810.1 hypothetical protein RFI_18438 [Reticulomyxa filosa]